MNELNNFFLGVQQVAQDAVDKAPYDRTFRGVIEEINGDGTCNVRINGRIYENIKLPQEYHFDYSQPWDGDLNVLGNFAIQNNTMVDYIVEQGTSGIWNYRKWANGTYECWAVTQMSGKSWLSWGSIYYISEYFNFPITFVSTPTVSVYAPSDTRFTASSSCWTGSYHTLNSEVDGRSKVEVALYRPTAGTVATYPVHIRAIGRWK